VRPIYGGRGCIRLTVYVCEEGIPEGGQRAVELGTVPEIDCATWESIDVFAKWPPVNFSVVIGRMVSGDWAG